jgi:hypothetical protein
MNINGSVITEGKVRPFVLNLDSGELRLDVYEPEVGERMVESLGLVTDAATRELEQIVRQAAGFPIDQVIIGKYFCERGGHWVNANKQEWSVWICLYCSLDQGTELCEYFAEEEARRGAAQKAEAR